MKELTDDEVKLLNFLVKKELDAFLKEKKTVLNDMSMGFMKSESMNEEFLVRLLKKLK